MSRTFWAPELLLLAIGAIAWILVQPHSPAAHANDLDRETPAGAEDTTPARAPTPTSRDWIGRRIENVDRVDRHVVRGVVRGPDGVIAGATVYAHELSDSDRRRPNRVEDPDILVPVNRHSVPPVASTRSRADGSYELSLPARAKDWQVDLGCVRSGYERRLVRDVCVPCEGRRVDWTLGRGIAVRGFVTNRDGSPIEGLRIRVSRRKFANAPVLSTARFDTSVERCADRWSSFHEGSAVTGTAGAFQVRGLAPGRYSIVAESAEWIVVPALVVRAPAPDLHVVVARANSLTVDIDPGATDIPIDKPRLNVSLRRPVQLADGRTVLNTTLRSGVGRGNTCRLVWAETHGRGGPACPDLEQEVFVTLELHGFENHRWHFPWNLARERHKHLTVELEPRPRHELLLSTQYSDGSEVEDDLIVEYASSRSEVVGTAVATRVKPWLHRCELPEGMWVVRIREDSPFSRLNSWRGEVKVLGKTRLHDLVIPKGGLVTVDAPPGQSMRDLTVVFRGGELSTQIRAREHRLVLPNVPVGAWEIELSEHGKPLASQRIEVRSNGDYAIHF